MLSKENTFFSDDSLIYFNVFGSWTDHITDNSDDTHPTKFLSISLEILFSLFQQFYFCILY